MTNIGYIISNTFHRVDSFRSYYYEVDGERVEIDVDEFYWRSCVMNEGDMEGAQGYMIVWLDDEDDFIDGFHTYRYPPDLYPKA